MPRLSKEEHDNILKEISDKSNADPEMMDLIGKLRSDFDESLTVDLEETERKWNEKYSSIVSERDKAIGERDEVRRLYRERFFTNAQVEAERIIKRQKEDSPRGMNDVLGIKDEEVL